MACVSLINLGLQLVCHENPAAKEIIFRSIEQIRAAEGPAYSSTQQASFTFALSMTELCQRQDKV